MTEGEACIEMTVENLRGAEETVDVEIEIDVTQ